MKNSNSLKEILRYISVCPVCGHNYNHQKAHLFARQDNVNLAHINCSKCQSNFIAMIIFLAHGVSSVGMVSDLTLTDAEKLCRREKIKVDELIDYHRVIAGGSEDFIKCLI